MNFGGGTVVNYGTIAARFSTSSGAPWGGGGIGVFLYSGGTLSNLGAASRVEGIGAGVQLIAPASVTNAGAILGTGVGGAGIRLFQGGSFSNAEAGAVASGLYAGVLAGRSGGLVEPGDVPAIVTNAGTISGGTKGIGLSGGGTITNGSSLNHDATISGGMYGISVIAHAGTVTNFGTVTGAGRYGIGLTDGGRIFNTGSISGAIGVTASTAPIALLNHGTIASTGTAHIAVQLGDLNDKVSIDPHAVFDGSVRAGGGIDSLVLTPGGAIGTLSGLGTDFVDFERLIVSGATNRWRVAGTNTLPSNATIDVTGRLLVTGALQVPGRLNLAGNGRLRVDTTGIIEIGTAGGAAAGRITVDADGHLAGHGTLRGPVTDNGTITASHGTLEVIGNVKGSGTITINPGATASVSGLLTIGHFLFNGKASNETLVTTMTGDLPGIIAGFANHDAIDLVQFSADPALTTFAGSTLTLHQAAGGPGIATLHFSGTHQLSDFVIGLDAGIGTLITHA